MKTHFRFSVLVAPAEYELVLAQLYSLDMQGCEEIDSPDRSGSTICKAYFSSASAAQSAADAIKPLLSTPDAIVVEPVPNQDWNAEWRKSMQPAQLAPSWWVSPLWLPPSGKPGDTWIKIEPKMAFGTGHHESTRLAANALIQSASKIKGTRLLDIGTGSGVLCFTGAILGAATCLGVELDGDCRENLAENRENNPEARGCTFMIGTIDALSADAQFDVIVMNMIHTESAPLLSRCKELCVPGGRLVWSGILADEYDAAVKAASEAGFNLECQFTEHEWWCGVFCGAIN